MRYLVSYDLRAPNKDYSTLWKEFKSLKAKRVLDSVWIVSLQDCHDANAGAVSLFNRLIDALDTDDGLLVTHFTSASVGAKLLSPIH